MRGEEVGDIGTAKTVWTKLRSTQTALRLQERRDRGQTRTRLLLHTAVPGADWKHCLYAVENGKSQGGTGEAFGISSAADGRSDRRGYGRCRPRAYGDGAGAASGK